MEDEDFENVPTLDCKSDNCNSCSARFKAICRAGCESDFEEEDTKPSAPVFLEGFDDDYLVDARVEELGGEG